MKQYVLTFEKDGKTVQLKRYMSPAKHQKTLEFIASKERDKNGILLVSCEECHGINPGQFVPSMI